MVSLTVIQQSALAWAESPVLMEIDIKLSAQNVTVLVYNPLVGGGSSSSSEAANAGSDAREARPGQGQDVGGGGSVASAFGEDPDDLDDDDGDLPEVDALSRQHSGGSVSLGESEVPTEKATLLRERLELPALVASVVIDVRKKF